MIEYIYNKLAKLQANGTIDKMNAEFKQRAISYVSRPKKVVGIKTTEIEKEWKYDPTVTLNKDLADQDGKVFYNAGASVNPLDYITLSNALIFIDGDDEKQIEFALEKEKEFLGNIKIILVSGPIVELIKRYKKRFYFDQEGILTSKLQITQVPAIMQQNGKELIIRELLP